MLFRMSNEHRDPALTVRPPAEVLAAARVVLDERQLEIRGFVSACLSALAEDPAGFLARLEGRWPPVKPRGRPRSS